MLSPKDFTVKRSTSFSTSSSGHLYYLEDLTVKFGEIEALRSVQLQINHGEIVFLTGASGAGKTTLLKVLGGLVVPTKGRALIPSNGENFFTSMVFQDLRLLSKRTCEDNIWVSYDPSIYRGRNEYYSEMMELCKLFGVVDRLNLKMADANGGLKQKVAIIRALMSRPNVLLADEPTSSLDHDNSRKLFDVLNFYNTRRGLTVLWATHNRELVKNFSGRTVHLDSGRVVYSGHACFI